MQPSFKYHPDPVKTGIALKKDFLCIACNQKREYAYVGPIYSIKDFNDDEHICFDCIKNGTASDRFDAEFAPYPDNAEALEKEEIETLTKRTPGYISWQDPVWLTHCNSICEFHGDFIKEELLDHFEEVKNDLLPLLGGEESYLKAIVNSYDSKYNLNPAFYKFICPVCKKVLAYCDYT